MTAAIQVSSQILNILLRYIIHALLEFVYDQSLYLTFLIQNLIFQFSFALDGMRHPKPNFFIPKYPLSTIKKGLNFNFLILFLNILKSCMLP